MPQPHVLLQVLIEETLHGSESSLAVRVHCGCLTSSLPIVAINIGPPYLSSYEGQYLSCVERFCPIVTDAGPNCLVVEELVIEGLSDRPKPPDLL